jgi:hypothetical protein
MAGACCGCRELDTPEGSDQELQDQGAIRKFKERKALSRQDHVKYQQKQARYRLHREKNRSKLYDHLKPINFDEELPIYRQRDNGDSASGHDDGFELRSPPRPKPRTRPATD